MHKWPPASAIGSLLPTTIIVFSTLPQKLQIDGLKSVWGCLGLLVAGFRRFKELRQTLLDEVMTTVLPNLPASRSLRKFVVGNNNDAAILAVSALLFQMMQACLLPYLCSTALCSSLQCPPACICQTLRSYLTSSAGRPSRPLWSCQRWRWRQVPCAIAMRLSCTGLMSSGRPASASAQPSSSITVRTLTLDTVILHSFAPNRCCIFQHLFGMQATYRGMYAGWVVCAHTRLRVTWT